MKIQYEKKYFLLQKSEQNFFFALRKACEKYQDVVIVPQVHLERIIKMHCEPHGTHCENYFYHGISELSFDFVLFNRSFSPLLAIELDGSSHSEKRRQERDAFVKEICRQSDLPLLRIEKASSYNVTDLEKEIVGVMK